MPPARLVKLALAALLPALAAHACEGPCIVQVTQAFVGNYTAPVAHAFAAVAARIGSPAPVAPLRAAFTRAAHASMQQALFPGFFHGKCQVHGVDPPGCPKPDCPVVCGTPGSMVHFYSTLTHLAYNATAAGLARVCAPHGAPYKAFAAAARRSPPRSLREACARAGAGLARACGGDALPACSWTEAMKTYILTFP